MLSVRLAKVIMRLLSALGTGKMCLRMHVVRWPRLLRLQKGGEQCPGRSWKKLQPGKGGMHIQAAKQRSSHVIENEVWVSLWNGLFCVYVMPHNHIAQPEVRRGPVRKVADDEAVGVAAMLVQNDEVSHLIFLAGLNYFLRSVAATIDALGVGHEQAHLLQKHL